MFATQCSNPPVTKGITTKNEASSFPVTSFEAIAMRTAAHTNMLQRIPDVIPCNGVSEVFPKATFIV